LSQGDRNAGRQGHVGRANGAGNGKAKGHANANGHGHTNGHGKGRGVLPSVRALAVAEVAEPPIHVVPSTNGAAAQDGVAAPRPATGERTAVPPPARIALPTVRDAIFRRLLAIGDLLAAAGGLAVIGALTDHGVDFVSLATIPLIVVLAKMTGRYDHDEFVLRKSTLDEIPALFALAAGFALAWSMVAFIANDQHHLRGAGVALLWGSTSLFLVLARTSARSLAQSSAPRERVLIVGSSVARARLADSLASDPGAHLEVVGFLPLEDERRARSDDWGPRSRRKRQLTFDHLPMLVEELDVHRVFLIPTSADNETMLDAVSRTTALGVKVSIVPRLLEVVGSAVEFDTVGGVTLLGVRRPGLSRSSRAVKRGMDLIGSALGLLVLAPFGLLVAIAIRLDSPGPIFFRQQRVGRDGRVFSMFKFRSMVAGAEAQRAALQSLNETDGLFKLREDPRVTRVGRLLRRSSIDELPQLINVLLGDMSLVGPRPLVLDEDRLVEGRHRERLQFAPGMTGPWQVLGPRRPPLSEMVKTDYLYAANWSLWTDIKILVRTAAHVVAQRGM
jgi:exopolysaccharide biosynthesis polyprenyl glycosylphosphotransferase